MGYKQNEDNHALMKPLLILSVICLLIGIVVCGIAGHLATVAHQFRDPRYATYWMGISAVVVFLLFLFIYWNIRKQRGMAMFAFVVFTIVVLAGTVCCIIAMANLAARSARTHGVQHGNCLYINKEKEYTGPGIACRGQCEKAMKRTHRIPDPPETCCCCFNPSAVKTYGVVADRKVSSCNGMKATALNSVIALAVLNGLTAVVYLIMTVLCLIVLCGGCGHKKLFDKNKDKGPYNPYE
ncbi:uncharacterized protein LOC135811643 [Sycon ciliatum]|uniref:uncharacterized protein LOC135811643 n=1 Tax=Sycon ciliatum TaxID=27933 RepID=UPI0031F7023D